MSNEYDDEAGRRASGPARPSGSADPTRPTGPTDPTPADVHEPPADDVDAAEQDRVARLLADAGGDVPMPADVAARLDALVADLAAAATDPPATDGGDAHPVDELAARRRRRRWPQLLVAAATVSVVGLGIGSLLGDLGTGGADSESTAGVAAEDADAASGGDITPESGPAAALREQDAPDDRSEELAAESPDSDSRALASVGVPRLRTGSLAVDLQRAADLSRPADGGPELARLCVQPDLAAGDEWLRVRLDGAPAVLVLRAPEDGRRTAEVFTCDGGDTPAASGRIDTR